MPSFQIGRYPVTVFEYEKYLDGCQIDPGSEWKESVGWEEQLEHPSRPVVRLTCNKASSSPVAASAEGN